MWFEITTLLIPGENDGDEELDAMTRWVVGNLGEDVPMHFTAFHPDWRMLDKPRTPPATLSRARGIAQGNGVRYAYTGNVFDPEGGSTRCHVCGALLVGRNGYEITGWGLDREGGCAACGATCAGLFAERHGSWGSRRRPVRLKEFSR